MSEIEAVESNPVVETRDRSIQPAVKKRIDELRSDKMLFSQFAKQKLCLVTLEQLHQLSRDSLDAR